MDANETCNTILNHLKKSNLNWNLVESPFSVTINLKKSFIKDKAGVPLTSRLSCQHGQNTRELKLLQSENESLCEMLNHVKKLLDNKTKEVKNLNDENHDLNSKLSEVSDELHETKQELTKNYPENKSSKTKKLRKMIYETKFANTKKNIKLML